MELLVEYTTLEPKHLFGCINRIVRSFKCEEYLRDELVQEVLIKTYSGLSTYDPRRSSLDTWLYSIARNCYVDLLRRESKYVAIDSDKLMNILDGSLRNRSCCSCDFSFVDFEDLLKRLLARIPFYQKEAFALVYIDHMSIQEASEHLGVSVEALKSRLKRARSRLRGLYVEALCERSMEGGVD